jgi:hypothetical protein
MRIRYTAGLTLLAVLAGGVVAADGVKSGPQPGQGVTPFNPLHSTGPDQGKKTCPV